MTPAVFADTEQKCQSLEPQLLYPLLRDDADAVLSSASWTQVTAALCSMGSKEQASHHPWDKSFCPCPLPQPVQA